MTYRTFFGDAEHDFTLGADQILELERVTGAGLGELCRRVFSGSFRWSDITETVRLALIGGGLDPKEAAALVKAYVVPPIESGMTLAVSILSALYFGSEPQAEDEIPAEEFA